jgi:glutamate-1-semialdehyde 2,1-aminomutase
MQLGTLSGNPIAAAAGIKTMEILRREGTYDKLRSDGARVMEMFRKHLGDAGHTVQIVGDETLFDLAFIDRDVRDYRDYISADGATNLRFNDLLRARGILKPPGKTYICAALTEEDLQVTEEAIEGAAAAL